jgi:hypothetical protein
MGKSATGQLEMASRLIGEVKGQPMQPGQCGEHLRKKLAEEFEAIVQGFVEEAKKGGCQHVKLVTELLKDVEPSQPKKKGPATRFLEEWERERPERERLRVS